MTNVEALITVLAGLRAEVYRRHRRQLRCIGSRVDPEDVYQSVCMRAWRSRKKCHGITPAEIRNWVLKIAANECRNALVTHFALRRTVRQTRSLEPALWNASYLDDPADKLIEAETRAQQSQVVRSALRRLMPIKQRHVVRSYYVNGWSYERIAESLGTTTNYTRILSSQGVRAIKAAVVGMD